MLQVRTAAVLPGLSRGGGGVSRQHVRPRPGVLEGDPGMTVSEAIYRRRSIRKFQDRQIPKEDLELIRRIMRGTRNDIK